MKSESLYILGAGGHAKVVISAAKACGLIPYGVFDDNPTLWGGRVAGVRILGGTEKILELPVRPCVIAIGNNRVRRALAERLDLPWQTVIHPSAVIDSSVTIGMGTVILHNTVLQADASIGQHVIINTSATIDHDCTVEDFSHVCPGCHLAGNVRISYGAMCGIGSCVAPGVNIGPNATIGAGAAVVKDIPANVVAFGVPARVRRFTDLKNDNDIPSQISPDIAKSA